MNIQLEVCIDNIESLSSAISGGANRIELCSSLALGGLTPSAGFIKQAISASSVPVYIMIRPRQGDFLYSSDEVECMLEDIHVAKKAGAQGIVFGVLKANGEIDQDSSQAIMTAAKGMGTTFHRAIDMCCDYQNAIEVVSQLGCERILTSGLDKDAYSGRKTIAEMVKQAAGRFSIMAGAGVNASNVKQIIAETGVHEVHLSGKSVRPSYMKSQNISAKMGNDDTDDLLIPVTSEEKIRQLAMCLKSTP